MKRGIILCLSIAILLVVFNYTNLQSYPQPVEPGCYNCHDKDPHHYVKGTIKVKPVGGYGFEIDVIGLDKNERYVIGAELVDSEGNIIARKFHTLQLPITLKAEKPGRYLCYVGGSYNNLGLMYDSAYADAILGNTLEINSVSSNPVCSGDSLFISYNASGNINSETAFIAQISDADGRFINPVKEIGRTYGNVEGIIPCYIPIDLNVGNNYKIRVLATFADISSLVDSIEVKQGVITEIEGAVEIVSGDEYDYRIKSGNRNQFEWYVDGGEIVWNNKDNNMVRIKWDNADGIVCVRETNEFQCSDSICIKIAEATSVLSQYMEKVKIVPNPAGDFVEVRGIEFDSELLVFDVMGRVVFNISMSFPRKWVSSEQRSSSPGSADGIPDQVGNDMKNLGNSVRVDISGLANGLYFVKVGNRVFKFIKI